MSNRKQKPTSLKDWRLARKLTIPKAAEAIGIPMSTYYGVERGAVPRTELLKKILKATGLPVEILARVA